MAFECWHCPHPQAVEVRAWLGSAADIDVETQLSPNGLPLICCRVRVVGVMPTDTLQAK
jgi:hypothetical protein